MKKKGVLVSTMLTIFMCENVMAQNSSAQSIQDLNKSSTEKLKNGGEVPGFISSPAGADLLRNAITNPDGSRTIKKGQQTPEANELNRKHCESMGARDVTNENDLTIGPGTVYAGVCVSSGTEKPPSTKAVPVPGMGTGRIFLPIPEETEERQPASKFSSRAGLQIVPIATNGSTACSAGLYYANSHVDFFNMPSRNSASGNGRVNETGPCSWTMTQVLGPGTGRISGFAACMPSIDFAQSVMTGCFAGACVSNYGTVSHY